MLVAFNLARRIKANPQTARTFGLVDRFGKRLIAVRRIAGNDMFGTTIFASGDQIPTSRNEALTSHYQAGWLTLLNLSGQQIKMSAKCESVRFRTKAMP